MARPRHGRVEQHFDRWRFQIVVNGQRIRRAFDTREEAESALQAVLDEIEHDAALDLARKLGRLTVVNVVDLYYERRKPYLEASTCRRYEGVIEKYIRPDIGDVPAKDLVATPMVLEDWLQTIPWGQARKALEVLGPAFRLARDNGLIAANPVDKIRRPKRPDRQKKKEIPTASEVEKIVIAAYEDDIWFGYFVELVATLGLRRGEACALRWEDFTFPKGDEKFGKVRIDRAVGLRRGGIYLKPPKSGRPRELLVHRSLFEGLWDFDGTTGWLFPGRTSFSTAGRLLVWLLEQDGEASCPDGRIGANARRAIGTNSATFSQASKALEEAGYLTRETTARRTFRLALTAAGLEEAERLSGIEETELPIGPTTMGHRFADLVERLELKTPSGDRYTLHSLRHFRATHLYNKSRDWVQVAKYLGHTSPAITMDLYANNVVAPTQELLAESAVQYEP